MSRHNHIVHQGGKTIVQWVEAHSEDRTACLELMLQSDCCALDKVRTVFEFALNSHWFQDGKNWILRLREQGRSAEIQGLLERKADACGIDSVRKVLNPFDIWSCRRGK